MRWQWFLRCAKISGQPSGQASAQSHRLSLGRKVAMISEDVKVDVENFHVEKHVRVDVVPQVLRRVSKLGHQRLQIYHLHDALYVL